MTTIKLTCPDCRRENEPERIYCHDCGARLDRSALAKEKTAEEDPQATQKRLRNLLDGRRALMRQRFFQGSKFILGAVALAAVVLMLRSPDLPEQEKESMLPTQIHLDLESAASNPGAGPLRYSEEQVNDYLTYALRSKRGSLSKYLNFERAVVGFEEGYFWVTVQRSLFGVPLSTSGSYEVSFRDDRLTAKARAGSIGRLPVHPLLMNYADFLFADVRAALERERKSVAKLGAVELHPDLVLLAQRPQ
jgi:hypothetical protein